MMKESEVSIKSHNINVQSYLCHCLSLADSQIIDQLDKLHEQYIVQKSDEEIATQFVLTFKVSLRKFLKGKSVDHYFFYANGLLVEQNTYFKTCSELAKFASKNNFSLLKYCIYNSHQLRQMTISGENKYYGLTYINNSFSPVSTSIFHTGLLIIFF